MNFSNIRNVKSHGNGYICDLDVDGETMPFYATPNGGGICDAVIAEIISGNYNIIPHIPPAKSPDAKRQEALAAKWPDPFALLDDILERGIATVKTERDAIKAANPKGKGV